LSIFGYERGQVPGFPTHFNSDEKLIKNIQSKIPQIMKGQLYTGDYFKTEHTGEPCLFDMEGTALYQVAHQKNIPIVSIKVVSDVMGMENHFQSYRKFEAQKGADMLNIVFNKLFIEVE